MQRTTRICGQCKALVKDILQGSTKNSQRWATIESEHAIISVLLAHHDREVRILKQSSLSGCQMCNYIAEKINELSPSTSSAPTSYSLFVKKIGPQFCEVQIGMHDIEDYLRPYAELPPCRSLFFFGQATSTPTFRNLELSEGPATTETQPYLFRLPSRQPGQQRDIAEVRSWLKECRNNHPNCRRFPRSMPSRLVDLENYGTQRTVALRNVSGKHLEYIAISYTWGERYRIMNKTNLVEGTSTVKYPEIKTRNIIEQEDLVSGNSGVPGNRNFTSIGHWPPENIPIDIFPTTLRDALQIVRALEYRYMWLDCLCILQDSGDDWREELKIMTDIYEGSALTIAMTDADNNGVPIITDRPNERFAVGSWNRSSSGEDYVDIFGGDSPTGIDLDDHFLSTRVWIFQERLVSASTVHYTNQGKVWECRTVFALDHDQPYTEPDWKKQWRRLIYESTDHSSTRPGTNADNRTHFDVWYDWMATYSEKNLYDPQDKFPAIAGLAKTFAQTFRLLSSSYVAGLWREDFLKGLAWRRDDFTETLVRLENVAPSWSWASVRGKLKFANVVLRNSSLKGIVLRIEHIDVIEEHPGTFERVKRGRVTVRGYLQAVTIDRHQHPGARNKPHHECGVVKGFVNLTNVFCMLDEWTPTDSRFLECYCLRLGSFESAEREGDIFLLLDKLDGNDSIFQRIGFVRTDAWYRSLSTLADSGVMQAPVLMRLTME